MKFRNMEDLTRNQKLVAIAYDIIYQNKYRKDG